MFYLIVFAGYIVAGILFDAAMQIADSFQRARYVIQQTEREYAEREYSE